MKRSILILLALPVLLCGDGSTRAEVLYTTFGPNDSFSLMANYAVAGSQTLGPGYRAIAMEFSPAETATLSMVRFVASATVVGSFTAALAANNGGQPGATLETLGPLDVTTITPTIFTLSSSTHSLLTANTEYWFILEPTDPNSTLLGHWQLSSPAVSGTIATTPDPGHGSWFVLPNQEQAAFDIQGEPTSAVPEPASLTLLGIGAVGLLACGWRRSRAAT